MFLFAVLSSSFVNDNPLRMWYNLPSSKLALRSIPEYTPFNSDNDIWQQNTLPIGNSFIGANIWGEIKNERLTFNEKSLWLGGPSTKRPNYNGGNNADKGKYGEVFRNIQQLFADGKDDEASNMCNQLIGDSDGYGSYVKFGDIYLTFDLDENQATDYVRYLDLDKGISYVQYNYNGATITREYFVSYPDNVLVIRITTTSGTIPAVTAQFPPAFSASTTVSSDNIITAKGRLDDNQMIFNGKLKAVVTQGSIATKSSELTISDATEIVLFVAAATDYKDVYPSYRTGESEDDVDSRVEKLITNAVNLGYNKVCEGHLADYQELFNRASLHLNGQPSSIPTNEQLAAYKADQGTPAENRNLEVLLFQYGRYLTIGSSRDGTLPSNLQGVWNDLISGVPWSSDYHMNINLQMNYWPTYVTNLAECALPLIDYVEGLRIPGRITAEIYAGIKSNSSFPENGFMAHTQNTPFGWTCPGWDFSWGWSPAAVPWILQNVFDYYLFTNDVDVLRNRIYPMMKEEAILYDQIMVEDKKYGRLVSSPTYSPEQGPRTNGNAYEQELIWQHYHNTIKAAKILNVDHELVAKWSERIERLNPIEIGDSGQVKEWYEETYLGSIGSKGHRHMSHLLGLYPGDLISVDTKDWMDAAIISLIDRGDITTGWGMGQRINAWSRTGDGNHAHLLIQTLFKNGIYNNLWDLHPPFQIDGNFGATSGMAEMLLQSNMGYINILPSLPDIWDQGEFDGFVARGNILVGVTWSNNKATEVRLQPRFEGEVTVKCSGINDAVITDSEGNNVKYSVIGTNRILFDGKANEKYTITQFKNRQRRARIQRVF
ncbi:hypothetical protein TRFO_25044 [Tritrichomonas foetus]|uniref:Uncharacterized protein n=1 Tax=Tritrichomonas foetus TaxID=1144522 RepID=A0A1J4K6Q6_9EUKA|nr:hypothetical protein TRFO_25044 [Tritrichomonas foetus]|eukprot:OHT06867.1 hypothetical protein TRFO_25044 [Tritrichomonas foetus]